MTFSINVALEAFAGGALRWALMCISRWYSEGLPFVNLPIRLSVAETSPRVEVISSAWSSALAKAVGSLR